MRKPWPATRESKRLGAGAVQKDNVEPKKKHKKRKKSKKKK